MRFCHYPTLLPLLLLVPVSTDARRPDSLGKPQASSVDTQETDGSYWNYDCSVEQELKGGKISLARLFTEEGEFDTGDFMHWYPKDYDPASRQRPLDLELSYIWNPESQPAVEARKIEVRVNLSLDTDMPEVSLIQIQRPFPVEPYGVIGSTALSTMIFPRGSYDLKNGHGELPLGDLLAYAEGYDTLDWTLVRPSDRLGGDKVMAHGKIDINVLREAVAALPELRMMLAAKTAKPKAQCERIRLPGRILD